jgi:hypothetical protein
MLRPRMGIIVSHLVVNEIAWLLARLFLSHQLIRVLEPTSKHCTIFSNGALHSGWIWPSIERYIHGCFSHGLPSYRGDRITRRWSSKFWCHATEWSFFSATEGSCFTCLGPYRFICIVDLVIHLHDLFGSPYIHFIHLLWLQFSISGEHDLSHQL